MVVGAGHAGGSVAAFLRQNGFDGELVLIGDEPIGPYHRPPLSKSLLAGDLSKPLAPEEFYADQAIALRLDTTVLEIRRAERRVVLAHGEFIDYDVLVLACGARARRLPLPGVETGGIHSLRTVADARTLEAALRTKGRLTIIGGGWVGLEVAASARTAGLEVTIIEREQRLLSRVASASLSAYLTDHHRRRGNEIVTAANVAGFESDRGDVTSVVLEDGRSIATDCVLIGVGASANETLALAAGLPCEDGVVVDMHARTADPSIYAVGDMTRRPVPPHESRYRLESIPSAVEQSRQAAAAILGLPAPEPEVPWFWSEQFDLKIHIAGLFAGVTREILRGDLSSDRFALFHTADNCVVAAETVNTPPDFMFAKQAIRDRAQVDPADLTTRSLPSTAAEPIAVEEAALVPTARNGGKPGHARITYIQHDGRTDVVDVAEGLTVMEGSVRNNLPGIIAECGGSCSCGTCHVYVDRDWLGRLDAQFPEEAELLEFMEARRDNSRLSCQIPVSEQLDGLVVRVPKFEG